MPSIPLFESYPALAENLPHVSLGSFPTPVERLGSMGDELGLEGLYVKRDDVSGEAYGGNKVRKLEFLLGQAIREGRREVMTYGGAGSNHATATAVCSKSVGLRSISMLVPQPNSRGVRRNLLMSYRHGAELNLYSSAFLSAATVYQLIRHRLKTGKTPMVIPFGGSSATGVVGFVNAAFELKAQIDAGEIPEPDRIYVAMGTMGTVAGLALGLRAAGLKSSVISVRVTPRSMANATTFGLLFDRAVDLLCSRDPSFPRVAPSDVAMDIRQEFYGEGYAHFTEEGTRAIERLEQSEGIPLEGTYTGKTFAALIHDAESGSLAGKTTLFWNTYNSRDFSDLIADVDYRELPRAFHRYFEEDVQPLDR